MGANINDLKMLKSKDKEYLKQLQKFFDLADNIQDENLRKNIIYQMLKCDEVLTQIAEKEKKL